MNHDASHCLDYDKRKSPKKCYHAELTRELERPAYKYVLMGVPLSWVHYKGTEECALEVRT